MILRRYGSTLASVDADFDPNAMTEVGFRRNREFSIDADEFSEAYERVDLEELAATAEGPVQGEGEAEMLEELEARMRALEEGLSDGEVLVVENGREDHPKTRDQKKDVVVEGKNRLYFYWRIEPPLRIGVYRRKSS